MIVGVFGLGEAGSLIAADLAAAGATVRGFDPLPVPTPTGVERCELETDAVVDADLVLSITAAADATTALEQALDQLPRDAIYADLSTASAELKRSLAASADRRGVRFADVALMAIVPGNGARAPALASGPGARTYVELLGQLGFHHTEAISDQPGDAATRKLLRSVFMKGLAAVVIEALRAGTASGQAQWLWGNVVAEIDAADATWLTRLVQGTGPHAPRRLHEMEASAELLTELGVDPVMTAATIESLHRIIADGVPAIPAED